MNRFEEELSRQGSKEREISEDLPLKWSMDDLF